MENISRTFFVLVAMFLSLALEANDNASQSPCIEYNVLESDQNRYTVDVTINKYNESVINLNNTEYTRLLFDNNCTTTNVGEPQFPMVSWRICIPNHKTLNVQISNETWEEFQVGQIIPHQETRKENQEANPFVVNQAIYTQAIYAPQILCIGEIQRWRGFDNSIVRVCPFEYYPNSGVVRMLKSFKLNVEFVGNGLFAISEGSLCFYPPEEYPFDNELPLSFRNANIVEDTASPNYLIIAANNEIINGRSMKEFLMCKRVKGLRPEVVSTAETGNSCDSIKNFIKHHYNVVPRYVLFVGGHESIPSHFQLNQEDLHKGHLPDTIWSDAWYTFLDGDNDFQSDLFLGRMPAKNLPEFENIIRKTIAYELGNNLSDNRALLMAHMGRESDISYIECSENIKEKDYGLRPASDMLFDTAYGDEFQGIPASTNQDVINKINEGVHILNYRGHGFYDRWGVSWNTLHQNFSTNTLDSLNNKIFPVVFSIACNTANLSKPDPCLMEKFLNSANGAVAFYGASSAVNSKVNDNLNYFLFNRMMVNYSIQLAYLISSTYNELRTIREDWTYKDHVSTYMIGGDPSIEVYTCIPNNLETRMYVNDNNISFSGYYNGCGLSTYAYLFDDNFEHIDDIYADIDNRITLNNISQNFYIIISRETDSHSSCYKPDYRYINIEGGSVQNKTYNLNCCFLTTPLQMGRNVDNSEEPGNVIIGDRGNVDILNLHGIKLSAGFKCEQGGILKIHK